ncbi:MAG TPA: arginine repressor [Blastocatellia bacterium]|nr:arginine repressor [Blastocatellia bacterium]
MHRSEMNGRHRVILEIISTKPVATQQELAAQLSRRGFPATQSSVSRDIVRLGLTKLDGLYVAPEDAVNVGGPVTEIDTAGDNLIVVKTEVGLAQPAALTIDRASIDEIVGTVAGDDTILIGVKNAAAQRLAIKKIVKLFTTSQTRARGAGKRPSGTRARLLWSE